ncbi:hypothetical protein [Alicyclobacillus macrosporangiidus]|uniref:Uncharacterized protein n=1 Tax=Alicyclobacillus macrosporangiidus TaxID=392015 RepID=A0A1I7KC14_9BACL|nr:hypothetical protein [Alicyclobacillus macrosporangiidus]SFU94929.1 hypothetical protein SAMN05421543_11514 [Alicyclobacillus macrosporangiidus]
MTYYRIQEASRNPQELLDPSNWRSTVWDGFDERRGVSCCRTLRGLERYFQSRGADMNDVVVVALEGEESEDEDFDADEGAVLVLPTEIVWVRRPQEVGILTFAGRPLAEMLAEIAQDIGKEAWLGYGEASVKDELRIRYGLTQPLIEYNYGPVDWEDVIGQVDEVMGWAE